MSAPAVGVAPSWKGREELVTFRAAVCSEECCPRCGHVWTVGSWPFCNGSPKDHEEPHYTFTWGKGGPHTPRAAARG